MCHRRATSLGRDGTTHEKRSLKEVTFVGSFPTADFTVQPSLPEVAFLGRSNVGKSSLLNALVDRKTIARTSKTPGKTRECNLYRVDESLYLVDLPGYGYARISKTQQRRLRALIEAYLHTRSALAGVVWLLDVRRRPPSADDLAIGATLLRREIPVLAAITKGDKLGRSKRAQQTRSILEAVDLSEDQAIITSAVTKEGLVDLRASILGLAHEAKRTR